MKIQLSKSQWELIGKTAGWFKNPMRATLLMDYTGDQDVKVLSKGGKEPYFIISGVPDFDLLDREKINEYLNQVDWTDRGAPGWITPRLPAKEFMKVEDPNDPYKKMRSIRVTYTSGEVVNTTINGTKKSITDYYLNPLFGPTDYDQAHPDRTHRPVKVEFLD